MDEPTTERDATAGRAARPHRDELWFFTSWGEPICPARDIEGAMSAIVETLITPRIGVRHDAS